MTLLNRQVTNRIGTLSLFKFTWPMEVQWFDKTWNQTLPFPSQNAPAPLQPCHADANRLSSVFSTTECSARRLRNKSVPHIFIFGTPAKHDIGFA